MRTRIISMVVVLGLAIVGSTLAQQAGEQSKRQVNDRAELRAQVIKLRVEVDLMQLDHDSERDSLLDLMKIMRQEAALLVGGMIGRGSQDMLFMKAIMGDAEAAKGLEEFEREVARERENGADPQTARQKVLDLAARKSADAQRTHIDRKRQDYAKQAKELAEKRLDLEDAERQYNMNR